MRGESPSRSGRRAATLLVTVLCAAALGAAVAAQAARAAAVAAPAVTSTVSRTAAFRVSWSDPLAPLGTFHVDYRQVGGDRWLHWKVATPLTADVFPGEPGRTYLFRAAVDVAGVPGEWSPEVLATVPVDQKSLSWSSGWSNASSSSAYLGSTKYAGKAGRSASVVFGGDALTLVAPKGPAKGKLAVYVREKTGDAWGPFVKVKTVDLYSAKTAARRAVALKTWSSVATREVRLVVTGTKNPRSKGTRVDIDGLAIRNAAWTPDPVRVSISPSAPTVYARETCRFTATVGGTPVQDVVWEVWREDRFGNRYTDDCGTMSPDGVWTAPATPTITWYDTPDLSQVRSYYVAATPVADPSWEARAVTSPVVKIRPPEITGVSPASAPEGGSITVTGKHFGTDPSQFEVLFDGRPGVVQSLGDTSATVTVYDRWGGWRHVQQCYVFVRREGVSSNSSVPFTVTGIKCDPPEVRNVNWGHWAGSPGDVLEIFGYGFDPEAEHNLVRFNDVVTQATSYWHDPYSGDWERGYISVVVPEGATTGPLQARRVDGNGSWSTEPDVRTFEVRPPLDLRLTGELDGDGVVDLDCHDAAAGSPELEHFLWEDADNWVFTGKGFLSLVRHHYETEGGRFYVDVSAGGQTWRMLADAWDDSHAVVRWDSFQYDDPEEFYGAVRKGDAVTVRAAGIEVGTWYERRSAPLTLAVSDGMAPGRPQTLFLPLPHGQRLTVAEDDLVQFRAADEVQVHWISAPGLWVGAQPFGGPHGGVGITGKVVACSQPGTYTITDHTAGTSATLVVQETGVARSASVTSALLEERGVTLWYGTARIEIPAGALPPASEADPGAQAYTVSARHETGEVAYADPVASDFGHRFGVTFAPEPRRLLKPVTISVPYSPEGRTSPPQYGLIDPDTGLYYPLDAEVDEAERMVTVTLPPGLYDGAKTTVATASAAPAAAKGFVYPFGERLNTVLRTNGVMSYNKVVGYLTDETRHLEVQWVRDPASSSYVDDAKAQEVLNAAALAYDTLVAKGWAAPTGWFGGQVSIHIRDLGPDPGGTNGGLTTKGVFGQPWVVINAQSASGPRIQTAVAHEMCHVFQRQYTTNLALQWIDEATAEWAAVATLPGVADLEKSVTGAPDFASMGIPNDFDSGFGASEGYAAGMFIVYLADTYGADRVVKIYEKLYWNPLWWDAAWDTLEYAFGASMEQMVMGFAQAYWTQSYYPLTGIWYSLSPLADTLELAGWPGVTVSEERPAMSSERYTVKVAEAFRAQVTGHDAVVRADALGPDARVYVYGDTGPPGVRPSYTALTQLTFLHAGRLGAGIGKFLDGYQCYRVVVINASRSAATPVVRLVTPHLMSTSPGSVRNDGGELLTVSGSGLGTLPGKVHLMGVECPVVTWTDTAVTVRTPNLGTYVGLPTVKATTAEGAVTNAVEVAVVD